MKRHHLPLSVILLFTAFLYTGCNNDGKISTICGSDESSSARADIIKLSYGTSFGMCQGYCVNEITITDGKVKIEQKSWSNDKPYEPKSCTVAFTDCSLIYHVSTADLFKLPETIGCPDCADGGAEWIEVETSQGKHKVTFEYQKEPAEITPYIEDLRTLIDDLKKNCN